MSDNDFAIQILLVLIPAALISACTYLSGIYIRHKQRVAEQREKEEAEQKRRAEIEEAEQRRLWQSFIKPLVKSSEQLINRINGLRAQIEDGKMRIMEKYLGNFFAEDGQLKTLKPGQSSIYVDDTATLHLRVLYCFSEWFAYVIALKRQLVLADHPSEGYGRDLNEFAKRASQTLTTGDFFPEIPGGGNSKLGQRVREVVQDRIGQATLELAVRRTETKKGTTTEICTPPAIHDLEFVRRFAEDAEFRQILLPLIKYLSEMQIPPQATDSRADLENYCTNPDYHNWHRLVVFLHFVKSFVEVADREKYSIITDNRLGIDALIGYLREQGQYDEFCQKYSCQATN